MTHWSENLRDRVGRVMESPRRQPFGVLPKAMQAIAMAYGGLVRYRALSYRHGRLRKYSLSRPVISIGNLEVGGTGKTPLTLNLAEYLLELGYRPVIVSRGYGGKRSKTGAVVSDGRRILLNARDAGDEPYLMASRLKGVPVVIGRDRVAAGQSAIDRFRPDVLILDDGFQHLRLHRDVDVVLLDARRPFGNGCLLPRGRLRESAQALARSHAVVLTRCSDPKPPYLRDLEGALGSRAVFKSAHQVQQRGIVFGGAPLRPLSDLTVGAKPTIGMRLAAFSGLARNTAFFDGLGTLDGELVARLGFEDHHAYGMDDIWRIVDVARRNDADLLVTTEKDYVRLPSGLSLPMDLMVVGADIDFNQDREPWRRFVREKMQTMVTPPSRIVS